MGMDNNGDMLADSHEVKWVEELTFSCFWIFMGLTILGCLKLSR
jgi:hypothetical protein